MRKVLLVIIAVVLGFAAWLAFGPSPISPDAWTPPADPGLSGSFAKNEALKDASLISVKPGGSPEDIEMGADGLLYTGLADGRIVRVKPEGGSPPEQVAQSGGMPLGIEFADDGRLLVADARRGLLQVSLPDGAVTLLSDKADGKPVGMANDLAISSTGIVYFSDSSARGMNGTLLDAFEGRPNGRLLAYDSHTGETHVALGDLRFANGVALAPDESFVLVSETLGYRVTRLWLAGPKAGTHDVFVDGLPGFPDNLSFDDSGRVWIAMPSLRNAMMDGLAGQPLLRRMMFGLFAMIGFPEPSQGIGFVVAVDGNGKVVANLQDTTGHVKAVSSVHRFGDRLVLGSIGMDAIATLPAP